MSTRLLPYTKSCFVCGADNPHGLRLRFRVNGDTVEGDFTPGTRHIGFQGVIHGGILATVLDEVMVWAASFRRKQFYFAVELTVRFSKPVAAGRSLLLVGWIAKDRGRVVETAGELRGSDGVVYARATAKYMPVPAQQAGKLSDDFVLDELTIPLREIIDH
jgi:acyl-coenzyme A thioesterase PaaI-like protein